MCYLEKSRDYHLIIHVLPGMKGRDYHLIIHVLPGNKGRDYFDVHCTALPANDDKHASPNKNILLTFEGKDCEEGQDWLASATSASQRSAVRLASLVIKLRNTQRHSKDWRQQLKR